MNLHYFLKQIGFSQTHIGEALKAKKIAAVHMELFN